MNDGTDNGMDNGMDITGLAAVLFDRDGTLVVDVPYNGDPAAVAPMPGACQAVTAVRHAGLRVGVVSNQSGIGRGLITRHQVDRVNRRVEELLGPFDVWRVCPHREEDGCGCRKPRPGMVLSAAAALGLAPRHVAVIGDIGSDMVAAHRAGAWGILVPTPATRPEELRSGPVASDLRSAVELLLAGRRARSTRRRG